PCRPLRLARPPPRGLAALGRSSVPPAAALGRHRRAPPPPALAAQPALPRAPGPRAHHPLPRPPGRPVRSPRLARPRAANRTHRAPLVGARARSRQLADHPAALDLRSPDHAAPSTAALARRVHRRVRAARRQRPRPRAPLRPRAPPDLSLDRSAW